MQGGTQKKKNISENFSELKKNNSKNITITIFTSELASSNFNNKEFCWTGTNYFGKALHPAVNIASKEIDDKDILRMCKFFKLNLDQLRKMQLQGV